MESWGSSLGFNPVQVVVMKASVDLLDQLGRSPQVDLSGMEIHMAHIGGQPGESGVEILSVPIPGQQPVNRKGMSQVVDAGTGVLGVTNPAPLQQVLEGLMDGAGGQAAGSLVEEERGVGRAGLHLQSSVQILFQRPAGGRTQRYPTSFSELAFGDVEALLGAVEVLDVQG
jgi:hypothetical protein